MDSDRKDMGLSQELARLEGQRRGECWRAREVEVALIEALLFYADPGTWFAVSLWTDQPCGAISEDYGEIEGLGQKPGQCAREALAALYAPEELAETVALRPVDRRSQMRDDDVDDAFGWKAGR